MNTIPLVPLRIGSQFKEAFSTKFSAASTPATGLLSQAVENLKGSCQRLLSLTYILPADAQPKEISAIKVLQEDATKISLLQTSVRQFVSSTQPLLDQAKAYLDEEANVDQIESIIAQSTASALALKQEIDATNSHINATKMQIVDLSISLDPIRRRLDTERIALDRDLQAQRRELDIQRAKSDRALRIGKAGLMGLILAEKRIDNLQAQVSNLRNQLADVTILLQSIEIMIADFSDIIMRLFSVSNAVLFIAGDNSNVIADLKNTQGSHLRVRIYLEGAISQLQLLQTDAD